MIKRFFVLFIVLLSALALTGCRDESVTSEPAPVFDAERSYSYLTAQVAFGPRVPGSDAWKACRGYYYEFFDSLDVRVDSQVFSFFDPYSQTELPLVNVIASFPGRDADVPGIVLMAHWDCRPRADFAADVERQAQPIDGANDGASGVAVLMELAQALSHSRPPVNVDLVLADGEDWGKSGDLDYYMLGSKEFARSGIRGKYRFGVVVDMIGDADQQIYREAFSEQYNKDLNDMIWGVAARLGVATFVDSVKYRVHDDHLSLNAGGVPSVDLIDFDYPFWHTEFDTPDRCSPEALGNVGRVLTEILYHPELWPAS